jgi:hypothetical protein
MHTLQEETDRIAEARAAEEQRRALQKRKRLEIRMQAVSTTNAVLYFVLLPLVVLAMIDSAVCSLSQIARVRVCHEHLW